MKGGRRTLQNGICMLSIGMLSIGMRLTGLSASTGSNRAGRSRVPGAPARHAAIGVSIHGRSAAGFRPFRVVALGDLGGGVSVALALNRAGWVVGYSQTRGGLRHAFLYRGGRMVDLGSLPGFVGSAANGIDDSGLVVGTSGGPYLTSPARAWLWRNGHFTDLGQLLHCTSSRSAAISSLGKIVGSFTARSGRQLSFMWTGRKLQILPVEAAEGVNDAGAVIGLQDLHGVLLRSGAAVGLQSGGSARFMPSSINNKGEIAGHLWRGAAAFPAIYRNGRIKVLECRGFLSCSANSLNNSGDVVGYGLLRAAVTGRIVAHAVLWHRGRVRDLNAAIRGPRRWAIESATAINDRGEIAARGYLVGQEHPSALLLMPSRH